MEKYYFTDDTALAAYFLLCGLKFVPVTIFNENDARRKSYIVYETEERPKIEEDFYMRKTAVAPLDYHDARVRVSRYLKNTVSDLSEVI